MLTTASIAFWLTFLVARAVGRFLAECDATPAVPKPGAGTTPHRRLRRDAGQDAVRPAEGRR